MLVNIVAPHVDPLMFCHVLSFMQGPIGVCRSSTNRLAQDTHGGNGARAQARNPIAHFKGRKRTPIPLKIQDKDLRQGIKA